MATERITSSLLAELEHQVWSRRARSGELPIDGSFDGWEYDDRLRCEHVRYESGLRGGFAKISYVPQSSDEFPFEAMLKRYTVDDHVQVVVFPMADEGVSGVSEDARLQGRIIFEGIISRWVTEASGPGGEFLGFVAEPITNLDREHSSHLITGRWIDEDPPIESPEVPAVFNYRGRPNMDPATEISANVAQESVELTARVFTHDDNPDAEPWTVQDAVKSIIVRWLFGADEDNLLDRHIDVEEATALALKDVNDANDAAAAAATAATLAAAGSVTPGGAALSLVALTASQQTAERWRGFGAILPEVNVHGMDWEQALSTVLAAGGFDYAKIPVQDYDVANGDEDAPVVSTDRRFILSIWRKGSGDLEYLDLDKRGSTYSSAEQAWRRNNAPSISGMIDATGIANAVYAYGRVMIECRLPLKPLWKSEDMDTTTVNEALQRGKPKESDLDASGYYAKHVYGGVLFNDYAHVGRAWGIDCVGGFDGYTSGVYQHDADGFDFVTELDLENATPIQEERTNGGVTDEIRWIKRVRHPQPLMSPTAKRRGIKFVLEVSEDGGTTWKTCPVRYTTLDRLFGISLQVRNLAMVSVAAMRKTGSPPAASSSWWGLLRSGTNLRFRLHCTVAADHALRHNATRQNTSRSRYEHADWLRVPVTTLWVQPGSAFNAADGAGWKQLAGYGSTDVTDTLKSAVRDAAERRRDALEDAAISMTAITPQMLLNRYQLGQRVWGVRGRNVSLAANTGGNKVYPNIVGITYHLTDQRIELTLEDQRTAAAR